MSCDGLAAGPLRRPHLFCVKHQTILNHSLDHPHSSTTVSNLPTAPRRQPLENKARRARVAVLSFAFLVILNNQTIICIIINVKYNPKTQRANKSKFYFQQRLIFTFLDVEIYHQIVRRKLTFNILLQLIVLLNI